MTHGAANMNDLWSALLLEELSRHAVTHVCLSPGSRSTPLALAAARHPRLKTHVHFDERGAAFFALGQAKASGVPAALICTSGTAVANYMPAVVEAAQSQIPLILITADRPPELQDTASNQTIDQVKFFGDYVRWHGTLPCPDDRLDPHMVLTAVGQAVYRAWRAPEGPVHLNCMFREPLAPVPDGSDLEGVWRRVEAWRANHAPLSPYTAYAVPKAMIDSAQQRQLVLMLGKAERGVLIVGQLRSSMETQAVAALAEALQWPVLPDVTSGLRLGTPRGPWIHSYDQLLAVKSCRDFFRPDVVLHVGGPVTSKRLQQHIENYPPKRYVRVAGHPFRADPGHRVTLRLEADIGRFCSWLAPNIERRGENAAWLDTLSGYAQSAAIAARDALGAVVELDEAALAYLASKHLENDVSLFLGNSMPIRDMDMFGASDGPRVRVYANRGASGIDGNIATAAGIAEATGKPVAAILGDLAALHDLNSMALLRKVAAPVILVIVNNDGGGIFHFLPVAQSAGDAFEPFFATPHGMSFDGAADQFGLQYHRPVTARRFIETLQSAQKSLRPSIIEVKIDRKANLAAHRALQEAIGAAVESPK